MEEFTYKHHNNINYLDFDLYSKPIGFFYHDKEKIGSTIGFIFTIFYIIISIFLFIFYTVTTINKRGMKVHDSLLFQKEAPEMKLNSNLFYFAFGMENYLTGYTRFIDETIYYPKVEYINKVKEGPNFKIKSENSLSFGRCQEEKFGKDYQHLLVAGELNNSYCINDLNLTLAGNFKYDKLSYIKIGIYPCINTTENHNHCKPQEVIDTFLSGTFISILAKDIGLEPSNYTHPYIPTFQDLYVTIDKKFYTEFCIFFGITEIHTDVGLLSENIHKQRFMNFMKTTQGIYYKDDENVREGKDDENNPICEVQIRMGDDIRIQKRTYMKMSEVFATVGGYMQLISTLFSFITFLINKINVEIKLVNSIFNFYPKKNRIALKYHLQNISSSDSPSLRNRPLNFPKYQNIPLSNEKSNTILDMSKHNLIIFNNLERSCKSINFHKPKKKNTANRIAYESDLKNNLSKKYNLKKDKEKDKDNDSSNDISKNNEKTKISHLTNGQNRDKVKIKTKSTLFEKNIDNIDETWKKNVKFNSCYYYCLGMILKDKKEIQLFNLAISFYKQKMDIIYLFHIILLVEKIWERKNGKINNQLEMPIQMKPK